MSRSKTRYFIELSRGRRFKLSKSEFDELIAGGWVREFGYKVARPVAGVLAWIHGADLHLLSLSRLRTSCASWVFAWLYKVGPLPASAVGETWEERERRVLAEADREAQNEALLWRTFRDRRTRGANSFAWIPAETKREILAAFGREVKSPPCEGGLMDSRILFALL